MFLMNICCHGDRSDWSGDILCLECSLYFVEAMSLMAPVGLISFRANRGIYDETEQSYIGQSLLMSPLQSHRIYPWF